MCRGVKRAFLWGCLLPVLAACAGGGESRGEGAIFPDPVPVEGQVRLSSILSRYRLIPLQTSDSSLVGAVVKVVKNDGRYYVSDRSDQLSVFDAQGRFLGRIAGRGAGPGEYGRLLDFDVDDRQVVILDYQRLHFYSLDGEYEKTVHMADNGTYVRLLSGGRILLASDSPQGVVCLLERNGEDGRYFVERGQRHHFRKGFAFVQAGAEVLFQDGVCTNDVWCFGGKEVKPGHLVDDSRALGASEEESAVKEHGYPYLLQPNSALKIWRLTGSARHLAFLALVDRQALWYVHDLSEKTTAVYDMTDGKAQIVDDITFNDQQPCLFLSYANRSDDGFVAWTSMARLAEDLGKHSDSQETQTYRQAAALVARCVDPEEANPVLFDFDYK